MNTGSKPTLAGGDDPLSQFTSRKMHARQVASVMSERDERVLIADIPEIYAEILLTAE
jgi:hypothetical protein